MMQKMLRPKEIEGHSIRAVATPEEQDGVTLIDFLRVIRARRAIVFYTMLALSLLTAIVVMQLTPLYTSTAVVMLDQRKNNVADTDAVLSQLPADASTVQDQVQIITSLELAIRVVDKLHLDKNPDFDPPPNAFGRFLQNLSPQNWFPGVSHKNVIRDDMTSAKSRFAHKLVDQLTVMPAGLSTAIQISYRSPNPALAALVANAVAEAYVEDQLDAKFGATKKATQWLAGRIQELSTQAQDADGAVQRYKALHNITETDGSSIIDQQTAAVSSQLVLARADLAEKQARYNNLIELQKNGHAADSAVVLSSTLIATLRAQETDLNRQLADLTSKYLPSHPKIMDLQAQKSNLEQKISEEIQRVVESVRNDVSATSAHVASLQQSLSALEAQGSGQNQSEVQLTALQSKASSARSIYEAFLTRLSQAQGQDGIQMPDARVISKAELSRSPSFPKRGLLVAISVPAGLILGLIFAFGAERLDAGFRTSAQVEALLGFPVVAVVPNINTGGRTADLVVDKPMSAFSESIRSIQLGIKLAFIDRQPKTVAVTSSVPGEGKTTVAINLARAASLGGVKTLLIDCDLRRPSVARALGIGHPSAGLIEALTESRPLDQCLSKDDRSGCMILPCLKPPPNPTEVLTSVALRNLLEKVRNEFDLVLLDCAPVLPVNDTKIISEIVDGTIVVTRWEMTPREAAANALRSLADSRASILGIVLARVDNKRFRYYSYGYQDYNGYDKYYSG